MGDVIYIDQTLHGYADGHQLLATSADLTPEQQSILLIMSDLSGPAFRAGYDSYLTGYSLSGGVVYCLARTWFAPELPRPGCVWTQTLLIRAEDLARIRSFARVNELFTRPTGSAEIGGYCRRLLFDTSSSSFPLPAVSGRSILRALYQDRKRIVISSESSSEHEDLLLAIFEQQWPRLRRSFRFCSGALSLRDTEFDLSVSPPEATHSLSDSGIVISNPSFDRGPEEPWLEMASRDLAERAERSSYRSFLWRFGPDFADGRGAFRPLSEVYGLLHQADRHLGMERVLSAIGYFYPEPVVAGRLKAAVFGADSDYAFHFGNEASLLKLLVSHPMASSIPTATIDAGKRAAQLAKDNLAAAAEVAVLARELGGEHAQQFLEGFFENNEWPDGFLERAPFDLLINLLSRYPTLVSRSALWRRADRLDLVRKLFSQIMAEEALLRETIASVMDAGAWDVLSGLISYGDSSVVKAVLRLIDNSAPDAIDYPDAIYSDVSRRNEAWVSLIQAGELGPRALKFLSADLDPRSWHVRKLRIEAWSGMLNTEVGFNTEPRLTRSSIFALSIGLSSWEARAAAFVAKSFSSVYSAAARNEIDEWLWQQLEPNLSWYSPGWDKCARLVRTVVEAFRERAWAQQDFFLTFGSNRELSRALAEMEETYRGRRFIKNAKKNSRAGSLLLSSEQKDILNSFQD